VSSSAAGKLFLVVCPSISDSGIFEIHLLYAAAPAQPEQTTGGQQGRAKIIKYVTLSLGRSKPRMRTQKINNKRLIRKSCNFEKRWCGKAKSDCAEK
jgi:hypothetical protein